MDSPGDPVTTSPLLFAPLAVTILCVTTACTRTPEPAPAPPFLESEQAARGESCRRAAADYLAARNTANFCAADDDCVELAPEPCLPAYYANIATADRGLRAREAALAQTCAVGECERPAAGAPRCVEGRCVAGRTTRRPPHRRRMSCWFERARVLELGRPNIMHLRGSPPDPPSNEGRLFITEPGELTVTIDMRGCPRTPLLLDAGITEIHHEIREAVQTYRMQVVPRELAVVILHASVEDRCDHVIVTPHLIRPDGTAVPAKHHGISYQPMCED
jgi:hypothetical protein